MLEWLRDYSYITETSRGSCARQFQMRFAVYLMKSFAKEAIALEKAKG